MELRYYSLTVQPSRRVQEKGHMATPSAPQPDDNVPLLRYVLWGVIALVLVLGIWLYLRFGREVSPLIPA